MRILWVKGGKILPVDTGGKIRSYNILRHLAAHNEVTFLSYYPGERDAEYEENLRKQFPGAVCVAIGGGGNFVQQIAHYALRAPLAPPYSVSKYTSNAVRKTLLRLFDEKTFDVAVCDFLAASWNFPATPRVPTLLFQHNVESALWKRQARYERNLAKRAVFSYESAKMYRYEKAAIERFHNIVAVSEHDRSLMAEMVPGAAITVVPTGVDVAMHRRPDTAVRNRSTVMFLGSMDWPANIDGVEFFCEQIWPRVLAAVPHARFQVVGRNPPERIRRLASDSVEIAGGVASVLPHLHAANVFVVPLRIGGGTRLKIYEAMAAGLPIVSTTVGAEGLDVATGTDIILADEPAAFADGVIALLSDDAQRDAIGTAAFATASRFDWSVVAEEFLHVLLSS
jgi:glycosyltransferase involved in cell wall biosynthesis